MISDERIQNRTDNYVSQEQDMKHLSKPPLPSPMPYYAKKDSFEQRCNWSCVTKDYVQFIKRFLRKSGKETRMDMSDPMLRRRIQAVIEYTDRIIERYKNVSVWNTSTGMTRATPGLN